MTPVYQEIVCPNRGDCMSACLASLMDLPITAVPKFAADEFDRNPAKDRPYRERDMHYAMLDWLHTKGYAYITIGWNSLSDWRGFKDLHLIASVPSQKFADSYHAVIVGWRAFENVNRGYEWYVAHDPNPGNAPYDLKAIKPRFVDLLVPLTYVPRQATDERDAARADADRLAAALRDMKSLCDTLMAEDGDVACGPLITESFVPVFDRSDACLAAHDQAKAART
jgi:hypothetical protein